MKVKHRLLTPPSMKENNEKKMKDEDEISKLIKAFPKDEARTRTSQRTDSQY